MQYKTKAAQKQKYMCIINEGRLKQTLSQFVKTTAENTKEIQINEKDTFPLQF